MVQSGGGPILLLGPVRQGKEYANKAKKYGEYGRYGLSLPGRHDIAFSLGISLVLYALLGVLFSGGLLLGLKAEPLCSGDGIMVFRRSFQILIIYFTVKGLFRIMVTVSRQGAGGYRSGVLSIVAAMIPLLLVPLLSRIHEPAIRCLLGLP